MSEIQDIKIKGRPLTKKDHVLVLAFFVIILWQLGAFSYIGELLDSTGEEGVLYEFMTVTPHGNAILNADSGELTASFINSREDNVSVEGIKVKNLDGEKCNVKNKFPFELAPKEKFNITANDCATKNAVKDRTFKLDATIYGTITTYTVTTEEQFNPITIRGENGAYTMPYYSRGLLKGTYT